SLCVSLDLPEGADHRAGCRIRQPGDETMTAAEDRGATPMPASPHTCRANAALASRLDLSDDSCFDDARRGFIDTLPNARIETADGRAVRDLSSYAFLEALDPPDSVNPSLWRMARLNRIHGLFQVCERIYQVRGFDLANITIIEGDTGLVIIDPLTVCESAAAARALYRRHRGDRPVRCVVYSHSHVDHYGGVEGVVTPQEVAAGEVRVIAPEGFMEAAVSENVLAGVPMRRRAMFQFGPTLAAGPQSHVDSGLGKTMGRGTISLIAPTRVIREPMETHVVDGVEIVFQLTPETEAPAEMNFFFPQFGVLNLAENGCHTMHNLCPLRGARTRDALAWSKYLDAALDEFIERTDVVIAQHPLADLGAGAGEALHRGAARSLSRHARPVPPAHEPRTDAQRDRGELPHACLAGRAMARAPLLRRDRAQSPGGLRALHGTLRRASGEPRSPAAGRRGAQDARIHGRGAAGARARSGGLRGRRVPLGGGGRAPPRVRRSGQSRGPRAGGRCHGAARLPERIDDLAQCLPARSEGAAFRRAETRARSRHQPQGRVDAPHGDVLRLSRHPRERREGRGAPAAGRLAHDGRGRRPPADTRPFRP